VPGDGHDARSSVKSLNLNLLLQHLLHAVTRLTLQLGDFSAVSAEKHFTAICSNLDIYVS